MLNYPKEKYGRPIVILVCISCTLYMFWSHHQRKQNTNQNISIAAQN